jgi:hypothetical protein
MRRYIVGIPIFTAIYFMVASTNIGPGQPVLSAILAFPMLWLWLPLDRLLDLPVPWDRLPPVTLLILNGVLWGIPFVWVVGKLYDKRPRAQPPPHSASN